VPAFTNDILKDDIILYPNPSNGEFSFKSSIKKYHLKIFNTQGEIFYNNQINSSGEIKINMTQIPKGIYIAKVENLTNHFVTTKKLIIK
jgi:hypothetical protein